MFFRTAVIPFKHTCLALTWEHVFRKYAHLLRLRYLLSMFSMLVGLSMDSLDYNSLMHLFLHYIFLLVLTFLLVFQVKLQNKADMRSGILCLNKKVITVLGGVVQSLYEEWQLKRKYMNVSRYKLRPSQENASSYPPPFEKLQVRTLGRGPSSTSHTSSSEGMHFPVHATGS